MSKTTATARKSKKTASVNPEESLTMNMQAATDLNLDNASTLLDGMLDDLIEQDAGDIDLSAEDIDLSADADTEDLAIEAQPEAALPVDAVDVLDALAVTDDDLEGLDDAALDAAPDANAAFYEAQAEAMQPEAKTEKKAKAPKAPKPPAEPRVTYVTGKASDVLAARVGNVNEMLLLEAADLTLSAEELEAKQRDLLDMLNARPRSGSEQSTQKKVAEKVVMLFGWMKKGGALNEVMRRTFTVLARDGYIVSGDKGNLHAELLAKPYSVGTCRAQAGQMMAMLPMLKIATKGEKGRLDLNPDSLIFAKVKADLGL